MGLPALEFPLTNGLQTKARQDDVSGLLVAQNVDTFDRLGGIGKIPGSSRKSLNAIGGGFQSLHYFEAFSLTGELQRQTLGLAGSTLYRINADQTLSSLTTVTTAEPLFAVTAQNHLHLASANNAPIKVDLDGSPTAWGVRAPGQTRTTLESFDSHSVFSLSSNVTASTSAFSQDGTGSTRVDKTGTSATDATIARTSLSLDVSATGTSLGVYVLIPSGALSKLRTSSFALQIAIGNTALSNANLFRWSVGSLVDGWNLLTFDQSSPDSVSGAGATLSNIQQVQLQLQFSSTSQTQSGFLWDWLFITDRTKCTAALGSSGSVDAGTHSYKVSFLTRYGKESNAGDASNTVTSVGSQINLTNLPVSPDSQVVARRIYRDNGGDAQYRFVTTIEDNLTSTYTDSHANASLSSLVAPEEGSEIDNSPPEKMRFVAQWNGYSFGALASAQNTLVFSLPQEPEYWPSTNTRAFSAEITALVPGIGGMLLFSSDRIYVVTGGESGPRSLQFTEVNPATGCTGPRAVARVRNAIMFWFDDGPYVTTSGTDVWYLGQAIKDQIDDLDPTTFANVFMVHDRERYRVLFFVDDRCLAYSYGNIGTGRVSPEGQGIDPLDMRLGVWSTLSFPTSYDVRCAEVVETSADTPEVWIGTSAGITYQLGADTPNWSDGSIPTAMDAIAETTFEKLIEGHERRAMLRYLIIKGRGDAASTWTATLTTADDAGGSQIGTQSFPVIVGPGFTSKKYAVPRGLQGVYAKLRLQNSTLDETGVVEGARLEFVPRPGRGER